MALSGERRNRTTIRLETVNIRKLERHVLDKRQFHIDGQWVSPRKKNDFDVIDPSTEGIVGVISLGGQADTDAAVTAANAAFEGWSTSPREERVALLERIFDVYKERSDDIAPGHQSGNGCAHRHGQDTASGLRGCGISRALFAF